MNAELSFSKAATARGLSLCAKVGRRQRWISAPLPCRGARRRTASPAQKGREDSTTAERRIHKQAPVPLRPQRTGTTPKGPSMFAEPITTIYAHALGLNGTSNGHHPVAKPPSPIHHDVAAKQHAPTTDMAALGSAIDEVSSYLQRADHASIALKHLSRLYPDIAKPAAQLHQAITALRQQGHIGALRTGHMRHSLQPRPAPLPEQPSGEEIRTWRDRIGYSTWELATILNVNSKRTVRRWLSGDQAMPAALVPVCNALSLPPIGGGSGEDLAGDAAMLARNNADWTYRREQSHVTRCRVCDDITGARCHLGRSLWEHTENALKAAMATRPMVIAGGSGPDIGLVHASIPSIPWASAHAELATITNPAALWAVTRTGVATQIGTHCPVIVQHDDGHITYHDTHGSQPLEAVEPATRDAILHAIETNVIGVRGDALGPPIGGGSGADPAGDARLLMAQTLVAEPCPDCDTDVATREGHLAYGRQRLEEAWSALCDIEHVLATCEDDLIQQRWLPGILRARGHLEQLSAQIPRYANEADLADTLRPQRQPATRCVAHTGMRRTPETFDHCNACQQRVHAFNRARARQFRRNHPHDNRDRRNARARARAARQREALAAIGEPPRSGADHPWRVADRIHFARKEAARV